MVIVGLVASAFWLATVILDRLGGPVTLVGRGLLIYWGLSLRSLGRWASRVSKSPKLSIETVAERANDAVVGPMFWFAVAGPAGLWAYQAVNILARFIVSQSPDRGAAGHPSVRLSRLMDAVPNWLTWLLFSLSAALLGLDGFKALQVGWREGRKHPARDQVWGLSTMAGALGVQLGGGGWNSGPLVDEAVVAIELVIVAQAGRILFVAGMHAAGLCWATRLLLLGD